MQMRIAAVLAFSAVFFFIQGGLAATDDLEMGAWQLDPAKSAYSSGQPPQAELLTIEPWGTNGIKLRAEITDAQGKTRIAAYSASFDGKDVPITGVPDADTVSLKRIDIYTTQRIYKKAGKVTTIMTRVVSKDGKTQTNTTTGTDVKGERVHQVTFFIKQ